MESIKFDGNVAKVRKKYARFVMKDSRSPLYQNDSLYYKSLQSGSDDYELNNLSINSPASEIGSYAISMPIPLPLEN